MTITIENNKLSIAFFKPWHFVSYNLDGLFKLLLCWVVILFYFLPYKSIFWKKKIRPEEICPLELVSWCAKRKLNFKS